MLRSLGLVVKVILDGTVGSPHLNEPWGIRDWRVLLLVWVCNSGHPKVRKTNVSPSGVAGQTEQCEMLLQGCGWSPIGSGRRIGSGRHTASWLLPSCTLWGWLLVCPCARLPSCVECSCTCLHGRGCKAHPATALWSTQRWCLNEHDLGKRPCHPTGVILVSLHIGALFSAKPAEHWQWHHEPHSHLLQPFLQLCLWQSLCTEAHVSVPLLQLT
mmetsp:Transcript_45428/g.83085  ORF Transcript_45428/g.83085 Transcript_45428/m.83085 type:complete len:214 (-) Transcript_45428:1496-2137(-)